MALISIPFFSTPDGFVELEENMNKRDFRNIVVNTEHIAYVIQEGDSVVMYDTYGEPTYLHGKWKNIKRDIQTKNRKLVDVEVLFSITGGQPVEALLNTEIIRSFMEWDSDYDVKDKRYTRIDSFNGAVYYTTTSYSNLKQLLRKVEG